MIKKITIGILAFILSLVSFEIFLTYSPFFLGASPAIYDKQIGMWHKKNFENYTIKECYKTKYIFDENRLPKSIFNYDKSKEDVILLGDSFIEAVMVKNENIIHNSLAKEFDGKYNFLNYGLSASSPTQQFVILKEKVELSNTKYVIQFIGLEGDLMDVDKKNLGSLARPKVYVEFEDLNHYKIIPPRSKTMYDTVGDLLGNYQMYFFIKRALYYIKDNIISKKKTIKEQDNISNKDMDMTKNWLYLKGAIHQIKEIIKKNNANTEYKVIITSDSIKNQLIMKKFLDNEHIEYIFLKDLAKKMNLDLESFKCDKHWNDLTHQNIAKIIKSIELIK